MRWVVTTGLIWLISAPAILGAEVSFSISSYDTYVGSPIQIEVRIDNAENEPDPPELPEIDGADVTLGGPSRSSFTTIVNGRMSATTTLVYTILVTPTREGTIVIPSITVTVDGDPKQTGVTRITVKKSDAGDLMFVKLVSARDSVYVGEPIEVTLEIWLKPFEAGRVRMDYNDMWRTISTEAGRWGPFIDVIAARNIKVRDEFVTGEDGAKKRYYVYSLRKQVWPDRPGSFDAGGIMVMANYPLEIRRNRWQLLGPSHVVSESRPITATVAESNIVVKPLPTEGQPEFFSGAVGRYDMEVSAKPTEANVGDPITLNIVMRGGGRLETLQAPRLAKQPALTADFRVPDESLAGVVKGNTKSFSQSIRAKHDQVTEIPPIAFAYFDPDAERYVTIRSDPISITIKESNRVAVSHVVDDIERPGAVTRLTMVDEGLVANYDEIDSLLADHSVTVGPGTMGTMVGCPIFYAACMLVLRRQRRLRDDSGFARKQGAYKRASAGLRLVANAGHEDVHSAVTSVLTQYIADRFNLPAGGLTRADATAALRNARVADELVDRVDIVLTDCETASYAGGGVEGHDNVLNRAKACVDELERCKL